MFIVMNSPFQLPELILASTSPRRRDLLKRAGLVFSIVPSSVDETIVVESSPTRRVKRLSEAKAADVARQYPKSWVLGADTIVVIGEKILGKPEDPDHARRMLQRLSGRRHNVLTGYCLINRKHDRFFSEVTETEVEFKRLTEEEIEWYIQTGEPFDKAGGYAIQGRGAFLVRRVSGSVANVIGLPLCEVIETLKECFLSDVIQDSR